MSKTSSATFRLTNQILVDIETFSKEKKISKTTVVEIALLEFLLKRDKEASSDTVRQYNLFLKNLKK